MPRQPEMLHSSARLWIAMRLDEAVPSRYCMHDGRGDRAPPLLPTREAADGNVPRQGGSVKRPAQRDLGRLAYYVADFNNASPGLASADTVGEVTAPLP